MVIIDADNHIGEPDKNDRAQQSSEEIIDKMNQTCIDKAVIFPFNETKLGISFSLANNYVAAAVKKYPDRLIGFARLDPNYGEKALLELERAVNKLGLMGVKLHPSSRKFFLDKLYVLQIIEKASKLGIPVVFDSGKPLSPPEKIGVLAEKVPNAKLIMAHMQGPKYLEIPKKLGNVYLGTTGMFDLSKLPKNPMKVRRREADRRFRLALHRSGARDQKIRLDSQNKITRKSLDSRRKREENFRVVDNWRLMK